MDIYLISGSSWAVPMDCELIDTIKALGAGGHGGGASVGYGGGGGGAYSEISNLSVTPGASISYHVGIAGGSTGSGTSPTANTWFKDGSTIIAAGGATPTVLYTGALGGTVANCVGDTKYKGGDGGDMGSGGGGNGGGAAGGDGAGGDGGNGNVGTRGGHGNAHLNGGGTGATWAGTPINGTNGTNFGGGYGSGGGGGGHNYAQAGTGGLYGAAGGGSLYPGYGTRGLIIISYTPVIPTKFIGFGGSLFRL